MRGIFVQAEDVLRARHWIAQPGQTRRQIGRLLGLIVIFGTVYGAVMGSFAGVFGTRFYQVLYSALKVPLLLVATFALGLPSFFVINTMLGLRDDFREALRALMATQAGLTIVLASFAPLTALWYVSFDWYQGALLLNTAMFGLAAFTAQLLLRRLYQPLIERDRRHRLMLRVWLVIYAFVGIQMGWVLRPFIGTPNAQTTFFRSEAWGNAYVHLAQIIWHAVQ